ncbi:MFS transporter [Cryptosporangium aurantiacum]|uniref:MFS transporter n=1 Tax=Cryptosporangium aurantiacum TaxID=134849 RepID=UPI0009326346|nr:MFS transporter [Cryptosporangium aurantiacum]
MKPRIHRAWLVAAVAFVALVGAAAFRAAPSVLILPLQEEFGWSTADISLAVTVNLVLFGLTAPFAAALIQRLGLRWVTTGALLLVSAGAAATVGMTARWQLVLCWGVLVGLGTGSMALVFAASVADRWFVARRGLVVGILTAGSATGQLVFLPPVAALAESQGWRVASLAVSACALAVVPLVVLFLRDRPEDVGLTRYGTDEPSPERSTSTGAVRSAFGGLALGVRSGTFWLLVGGFAICGASSNGLIGTHLVPAAHDHGLPTTAAASLLAMIGIFDIVGTIASGWLTDRYDPRLLLLVYYGLRGASLLLLPALMPSLGHGVGPTMLLFIVFYGLDWVATVPPTVALCRQAFGDRAPVVFGWVFASHQLGAALMATGAGWIRDTFGTYTPAWYAAGALCLLAATLSVGVGRGRGAATLKGKDLSPVVATAS